MSATLAQVEREALTLPDEDRAQLAGRLWDSLASHHGSDVVMTPELERLLDEGLDNLEQARTTDELRRQ
jgi:hypothetical protein